MTGVAIRNGRRPSGSTPKPRPPSATGDDAKNSCCDSESAPASDCRREDIELRGVCGGRCMPRGDVHSWVREPRCRRVVGGEVLSPAGACCAGRARRVCRSAVYPDQYSEWACRSDYQTRARRRGGRAAAARGNRGGQGPSAKPRAEFRRDTPSASRFHRRTQCDRGRGVGRAGVFEEDDCATPPPLGPTQAVERPPSPPIDLEECKEYLRRAAE